MNGRHRPSALAAFVRGDQAARLALVAALATGAAVGLSGRPDAAVAPPAAELADGGTELVRFHVTAERLDDLSRALAASAKACLDGQGAMLEAVARSDAHGGLDALEARYVAVRDGGEGIQASREANEVLDAAWLTRPQEERLAAHLSFREACLAWTERSVSRLAGGLTSDSRARFEQARSEARRDAALVRAIGEGGMPAEAESIEGMGTAGPRP